MDSLFISGYKLAFNYLKAKRMVDAIDICHHVSTCHTVVGLDEKCTPPPLQYSGSGRYTDVILFLWMDGCPKNV